MRFGTVAAACIAAVASVVSASADYTLPKVSPAVPKELISPRPRVSHPRLFSFRSIALQVDNQVIANLLADVPARANDVAVSVVAGEIARCESQTCQVQMTVRVNSAQGPIALSFAVANPKGELSEVQHAECSTGDCVVSLILERGQNTVSVGVLDGIGQATGYVTTRVNADRNVADRGKSEWF